VLGLLGGSAAYILESSGWLKNQNRFQSVPAGAGSTPDPVPAAPARKMTVRILAGEAVRMGSQLLFFFFTFAFFGYVLNGLIPQEWVTSTFGGGRIYGVPLAATFGFPFYINAEASLPLVRAMLDTGMSQGAALAFLITGAGTSLGALAGRLDWIVGWLSIAAFSIVLLFYGIRGALRDPDQIRERRQQGVNTKAWDRVILSMYSMLLVVLFPVCALDAVRFAACPLPAGPKVLEWIGMALSGVLILRVMAANTFASRTARIQDDRGQTVVSGGPYRYIRQPMYLGIMVFFFCVPLVLGSGWGLIPAAAIGVLFIARTALEDRMLARELAGYAEYAETTPYRLLPGIW
jgi:protein-S-isoprenylcysteine O-methyltransferase Ste14